MICQANAAVQITFHSFNDLLKVGQSDLSLIDLEVSRNENWDPYIYYLYPNDMYSHVDIRNEFTSKVLNVPWHHNSMLHTTFSGTFQVLNDLLRVGSEWGASWEREKIMLSNVLNIYLQTMNVHTCFYVRW